MLESKLTNWSDHVGKDSTKPVRQTFSMFISSWESHLFHGRLVLDCMVPFMKYNWDLMKTIRLGYILRVSNV